jgi:hypothetical protein
MTKEYCQDYMILRPTLLRRNAVVSLKQSDGKFTVRSALVDSTWIILGRWINLASVVGNTANSILNREDNWHNSIVSFI